MPAAVILRCCCAGILSCAFELQQQACVHLKPFSTCLLQVEVFVLVADPEGLVLDSKVGHGQLLGQCWGFATA